MNTARSHSNDTLFSIQSTQQNRMEEISIHVGFNDSLEEENINDGTSTLNLDDLGSSTTLKTVIHLEKLSQTPLFSFSSGTVAVSRLILQHDSSNNQNKASPLFRVTMTGMFKLFIFFSDLHRIEWNGRNDISSMEFYLASSNFTSIFLCCSFS
jgi:hypothetical protein